MVELGSITRAAESLNVAQPALGLQIRQLEAALGVALLQRHARGTHVTKAGEVLYRRASKILADIDETVRDVAALRGMVTIKLGLTPSLFALLGEDLRASAGAMLPQIDLVMVPDISLPLIEKVKRREIDLALVYGAEEVPGLTRQRMFEEELYLVGAPGGKGDGKPLLLKDVLQMGLVIQTERSAVYQLILQAAKNIAVEPNVTYSAKSSQAIIEIASHGLAVGILPGSVIADAVRRGRVTERRIERPRLARTLHLVRLSDRERRRSSNDHDLDAFLLKQFKDRGQSWFGTLSTRRPSRVRPGHLPRKTSSGAVK